MLRPSTDWRLLRRERRGDGREEGRRRKQDQRGGRGLRLSDDLLAHREQRHRDRTGYEADQGIDQGGGNEGEYGALFRE